MILLLSPQSLLKDSVVLQLLQIDKSSKNPYQTLEINKAELDRAFPDLQKEIKGKMQIFNQTGILDVKNQLQAAYSKQYRSPAPASYMKLAFSRKMHETIAAVLPSLYSLKWYHKVQGSSGKVLTSPCLFRLPKPQLQLQVRKVAGSFEVPIEILIEGLKQELQEFNRYHFFLEQNNEYHLLGFRDYKTIEWLQSDEVQKYGRNEEDFLKHVLLKLEENYKVNRNDLFSRNLIDSVPQSRVMVSELSGSFLMLTPQWLYEGILIEGAYKDLQDVLRDGTAYSIKRNEDEESAFLELLKQLHPSFANQRNGYFFLTFDEAKKKQWFLKVFHHLLEKNVQLAGMDMLKHFRYSEHKAETNFKILSEDANELRISLHVKFGEEEVPLQKVQRILLGGQSHLLLKDGRIAVLDEAWLQKYALIIKHGRIKEKELFLERWLAITQREARVEDQLLKPVFNAGWWQQWEEWQSSELSTPLPEAMQDTVLRPYQQKGYEWMVLLAEAGAGACLADDMGLGKTLQTICFLANRLEKSPQAKHMVVCPSSLIYNWQQELQKFAPKLRALVYHGPNRRREDLTDTDTQIVITSYGTLRLDIETLSTIRFSVAVLDESHNIKNPYAQITQAANRIKARTKVALSGTPVMNNTFDLYSQLNFLLPGLFGSRDFFKQQYSDAIDRDHDPVKTKVLQKLTAPFILRRTKEQVASDLPEKIEQVLWCDMGQLQMDQYETVKNNIRSSIFLEIEQEGLAKSRLSIIQGITRLRQVCNSPLLLPYEDQICRDSVKTEVLVEELKSNLKGHKVLVFSQFARMLDLLVDEMEQNNISFYKFDGQTPSKKRMEMVEAFQSEGNDTQVFLISLMAGNAGLNLTAADYVFLFDPWWNVAMQQQAIDRAHRIGQKKNVFAYKMACRDTIEEKIMLLQERKKALAEELIGVEEGFVKNLSLEDIEFLFK